MTTRVVSGGTCDLSSSGASTGWGDSGAVTGAPCSGRALLTRAYPAAVRWGHGGSVPAFVLEEAPVVQRERHGAQTTDSVGSNPTRGTFPSIPRLTLESGCSRS